MEPSIGVALANALGNTSFVQISVLHDCYVQFFRFASVYAILFEAF